MQAALHGADIKDGGDGADAAKNKYGYIRPPNVDPKFEGCVPGAPETYGHLTKEERKEWTDQLIQAQKGAAQNAFARH